MIKVIIFDADGVVINSPKRFSVRFSEEYNIALETVLEFFTKEFDNCVLGKADLKERIAPYLKKWDWKGNIDDFLKYWFGSEHALDSRVLNKVKELSDSGIKCFVATNQEKYRSEYIWNVMGLKDYFEKFYTSSELGFKKPSHEFYEYILKDLDINSKEVFFIDDDEDNIKGAEEMKIKSHLYKNFEDFEKTLAEVLNYDRSA
jgi:putative hydrolase of the HAD superfamily